MNIGIVAPFNPLFVRDYLDDRDIPYLHNSAMAVNTLVRSLILQGHNVKVFTTCPNINNTKILSGKKLKVYLVPNCLLYYKPTFSHSLLLDSYYVPHRLARLIKSELSTLDVIHAHWTYDYALACLKFVYDKPVFVTVRDWCPYILSIQKGMMNKIAWLIKYLMFKKVMKCSELHIIANSEYTHNKIISRYPEKKVEVIYNPIDERYIIDKKVKNVKDQFITIAQIVDDPRKNIENLLFAFKMYKQAHKDAHLHVIGRINIDGRLYMKWVENELLEGVSMYGNLDHEKMMEMMDNMSCLVHPSLEETFGNILLEGMARCLPCIGGQASGAVPYVLGHGKYGLLCDVTNPVSIYQSMECINDTKLVEGVVKSANSLLLKNYSSEVIALKHIQMYQTSLS